jgi:hypothetical protein
MGFFHRFASFFMCFNAHIVVFKIQTKNLYCNTRNLKKEIALESMSKD